MSEDRPQREPDQLDGVPLPEEQPGLVGHGEAFANLRTQLEARRLPGGILIHGPQGVGKATLAFTVSRMILTATGDEDGHRVDEQVTALSHPNLYVLRRQPRDTGKGFYTTIRIDDIRGMVERLRRTRGRAGHRIVIVDSIDDCNTSSANGLLKILEEPPADTVFFLVSHRPGQLLPTIRSRCQPLALRPLADAEVAEVLRRNAADADAETVVRAISLAEGRPRRAFEALKLAPNNAIGALQGWLTDPIRHPSAAHLALADSLGADTASSEARFARDMLIDWLATEARAAAVTGEGGRRRLASANDLWDKAHALFADTDEYNIDLRQTMIAIFDAIRKHVQPEPTR